MPRFSPMGVSAVVDGHRQYVRDVGRMADATERSHGRISRLGSATFGGLIKGAGLAAKAVVGIGAAAGAALTAVGGLAVKLAIDATPLVDLEKGFNAIAENAGLVGSEVLAAMKDVTAGTIRAADLMQVYNKGTTLLGENFNDIIPIMGDLIAQGAAIGLSPLQAVEDFTTGVARESKMILDNLGITVQLSEAHETFAKSIGKSASELTSAERQAALLAAAQRELEKTSKALPPLSEFASTTLARFKTTMQETKDEIGKALVPVLKELIDSFQDALGPEAETIIDIFKRDFVPTLRDMARFIGANLPKAIKFARNAFFVFGRVVMGVWDFFQKLVIPGFNFLYRIFVDKILPILSKAWRFFETLALFIFGAGDASTILRDNLLKLVPPEVLDFIEGLKTKMREWYDVAAEWWEEVKPQLIQAFTDVKDYIVDTFIPDALEFLTTEFEPVIEAAGRLWEALLDQKDNVIAAWEEIKTEATETFRDSIPNTLKNLEEAWNLLIDLIVGDIDDTTEAINNWGGAFIETVGDIIGLGINVLIYALEGLSQVALLTFAILSRDWERVGELFKEFGERDREILHDLGLDILDLVSGPAAEAIGRFQRLLGEEQTFTFATGEQAAQQFAQQATFAPHQFAMQPATAQPAPIMGAQGGGRLHTEAINTQEFNLTINTKAPVEPTVADFRMLAALSRRNR